MKTVQKSNVGTIFYLTYQDTEGEYVDISSATTQELTYKKPSDATSTKTTSFVTDGKDGRVKYTTVTDDLDEDGTWQLQGKVILSSGIFYSDVHRFKVEDNLA